jgi:hypothetical protein
VRSDGFWQFLVHSGGFWCISVGLLVVFMWALLFWCVLVRSGGLWWVLMVSYGFLWVLVGCGASWKQKSFQKRFLVVAGAFWWSSLCSQRP